MSCHAVATCHYCDLPLGPGEAYEFAGYHAHCSQLADDDYHARLVPHAHDPVVHPRIATPGHPEVPEYGDPIR